MAELPEALRGRLAALENPAAAARIMREAKQRSQNENPEVQSEQDNLILAYLTCPQDSARGFLGAILLTDARTRPIHFGYVAPIRPTLMQRILYGRTLDVHVKIDVVVHKLSQDGLSRVPDVVFVDSEDLLAARVVFGVPTARLWRKPQKPEEGVTFSTYLYDTAGNVADEEAVGRVVAGLEQTVDLLDPFDRMREALKEALKESHKQVAPNAVAET